MKIVDVVMFNGYWAFVFDEIPEITYEEHLYEGKAYLIGTDESKTFVNCMFYEYPVSRKEYGGYAFGGREFDVKMKDGSVTHCWGQYYHGGTSACETLLGFELAGLTYSTRETLQKCYVFWSGEVNVKKLRELIAEFKRDNPEWKVWEYDEYQKHLKETVS